MHQQLPTAIIAATEEEALTHGQVMYGLVKPTKDMDQVESTASMVNVIPKKRTYLMTSESEMDLFMAELMKRPLVLQPSAYIGHGIAAINCALCTSEEKWIVLINQSHPKILSRIQMGVDMARAKMERGEPFVLQLSFNEFLTQSYAQHLTRAALNTTFMFINFEDAEIVVRYAGSRSYRSSMLVTAPEMRFTFDDLLPSEIIRRSVSNARAECSSPALRVIPPDELLGLLRGWEFEMIDPLEGAVFSDDEEEEEDEEAEAVGAVGGADPASRPLQSGVRDGGGGGGGAGGGRILGRSARKAQAANMQVTASVEMHAVDSNRDDQNRWAPPQYEDLNRSAHANEHTYANRQYPSSQVVQRQPHSRDSPYEEMNVHRQYGSRLQPHSPSAPPAPTSPRMPSAPPMPRTPTSPRTPGSDSAPRSPRMPNTPKIPIAHRVQPQTQRSPHGSNHPRDMNGVDAPAADSRKTYLTDGDEDGGFSQRSTRMPQERIGNKHDSNYNREMEMNRYGDRSNGRQQYIDPSDRYANSPKDQFSPSQDRYNTDLPTRSSNVQRSERPVPTPRGFHHHQGSGRSDTSASDSGFGEIDNIHDTSRYRRDKYNGDAGVTTNTRVPYYNHGYEKDSPEKDVNLVDDIMAKHKALAAQMSHQQPQKQVPSAYAGSPTGHYNGGDYGRELQKWRRNINDLEEACDEPSVNFSRSRLQVDDRLDQVEESFI